MRVILRQTALFMLLVFITQSASAQTISVAVASNALDAVKRISRDFQKQYGHTVRLSSGSTGKLYAQIYNGAPYDIFLAANAREPERLEQQGYSTANSRFTYAVGQLSLCRQGNTKNISITELLNDPTIQRLAIANPKTAPYGVAARQVLESMGLWQTLRPSLIRGENISQAYQYFMTGNTQLAFLATSQIKSRPNSQQVNCVLVEQKYYQPIRQQAVVLTRAANKAAVKLYVAYLKSAQVKELLHQRFGYSVE